MSAKQLIEICDRSLATVYRRISVMQEYDLVSAELARDPDGTQYDEYRSELNELTISAEERQLDVNVDIERDTVGQFTELIEDLEQSGTEDTLRAGSHEWSADDPDVGPDTTGYKPVSNFDPTGS